jgi:hypothetical protein
MKKANWVITQKQIAECDIDSAIFHVDPEQIADAEIQGLHGAVRLRIEGATGPVDIFGKTEARKFFKALHARWPYAAYFLRLKPITLQSPIPQIMDLSIFMALALCHVQDLACCETASGVCLRYDITQLTRHLAELSCRAAELGDCIGVPKDEIEKRDNLISSSVVSFFDAGQTFVPTIKNKNRRKNS